MQKKFILFLFALSSASPAATSTSLHRTTVDPGVFLLGIANDLSLSLRAKVGNGAMSTSFVSLSSSKASLLATRSKGGDRFLEFHDCLCNAGRTNLEPGLLVIAHMSSLERRTHSYLDVPKRVSILQCNSSIIYILSEYWRAQKIDFRDL